MKNYILLVILTCTSLILQAQTSTGKHHIKYLDINTGNSDYGVDFIDNNKVVFTASTSERVSNNSKYEAHLDLFEGEVGEEGEIINKSRNNGIISKRITKTGATFTNDKKTVYFTAKKYSKRKRKNPSKSEIFKADINESGVWTNIEKLSVNKKNYTIENPTLNKEENKLYFSSDLPSTLGGKDIFVSDINEDGTLSEPRNLGDKINTQKDEITPFIADNNFLYFSSNGREDSIGNFDIYTSEAFENIISEPLHLDSPINSINDDFAYIVNSDKGYFSSNRLQGQKNNDIYSFYIEPDKPVECLQEIVGTVRDQETELLLSEAVISVIDDEGQEIKTLTTDEKGNYKFSLDCRSTFTIKATKVQYSEEEHIVNTANYLSAPPLEVNQGLSKELISTENDIVSIKVNPIYFGFDKSNLNNDAKIELDKIVKVMKENSSVIVEAASHTDSRGSAAYNQKLSERRSQASVNYIVSKGIDESRIISKGYGESQLLNNCSSGVRCTNDQHQFNRRTEFIIINKQVLINPKQSVKTIETEVISEVESKENSDSIENNEIIKKTENTTDEAIDLSDKPNSNTVKKNDSNQRKDLLEANNLSNNTIQNKTQKNEVEIDLVSGETSTKVMSELNNANRSESNHEIVKNKTSDQKDINYETEVKTTESKFTENNIIGEIGFREPEPDKEEEGVVETTITNTNIAIADNHEFAIKKETGSKVEIENKEIGDYKSIEPIKNKSFNKEEETVLTEPSSSLFNETNNSKLLNSDSEKSVNNLQTPKELKEKLPEETSELNQNDSKESIISKASKISEIDTQTNIHNQIISPKRNSINVTEEKKDPNSDSEKNLDQLQVTKESIGKSREESTVLTPNDYIEIISSNDDEVSFLEGGKRTSVINKEISSKNNNISKAANSLFNEEEEDIEAEANNFSRDFTKDIVITDYKKKVKPIKKSPKAIIAEQKELFKKDYVSSTKTLKKEEVLVINSIDVSPIAIKNNGKYIETTKSSKVDVMRINFQVDNNKHITSGYKEVYILIQSPSGTILNRKGTFEMKNGKELTYTEKTNAYYNNNHLNISMVTDRFIQRIIKGVYTITIYIEGYPVGLEMLELS